MARKTQTSGEKGRWNKGGVDIGDSFDPGFVSPLNEDVRRFHKDFAPIQTIPATPIPRTMDEQMDGDEHTSFTGRSKGR